MYKVSYSLKNEKGYLVEERKKFQTFMEAIRFAGEISVKNPRLIGKPLVSGNSSVTGS
jgi:hypothetical protein